VLYACASAFCEKLILKFAIPVVITSHSNLFQSMLKLSPGCTALAAAYLRFESAQKDVFQARETAKSLLSADRTNLQLWDEYAQLEHKSGHLREVSPLHDLLAYISK